MGAAGTKGYLWERGRLTTIAFPGAVETQAFGIDNDCDVVGEYLDSQGRIHGFLWRRGRFTTIDLPGFIGASVTDINDHGDMTGVAIETPDRFHGFVRRSNGRVTTFDALGARITLALGINNRRHVVGYGIDGPDLSGARAFLATDGGEGRITPIEVRDAPRTQAGDMNNHRVVVGNYENTAFAADSDAGGQPSRASASERSARPEMPSFW